MSDLLLLRGVEVDGAVVDVQIAGGTVRTVAPRIEPAGAAEVVEGAGGALIPGLHDHHLHLLATAAARGSLDVGPPRVRDRAGLAAVLRDADAAAAPGSWLRAVGYHESVAGELDRHDLDELVPHRPVRVQHRTGAAWVLNSAAIDVLDAESCPHPGAERDATGRLTGRLHRADTWLRERLPGSEAPDLAELGAELARLGVTGVTDATPFARAGDLGTLAAARRSGALPQRLVAMGGGELADAAFPEPVEQGPVKVVIDDGGYPSIESLVEQLGRAHRHRRGAAIHCVTRASLVLALAAWQQAGGGPGDRIEHGSVIPSELVPAIADLGLTVVTQPGFVAERGDQYLLDVDPDDLPHLYRCHSLRAAGIPVAGSTDAPYTGIDPWAAMRAAVDRTTAAGAPLGRAEASTPREALALFLGDPHRPGGPPRAVAPGGRADLCLLDAPLDTVLRDLTADHVVATFVEGARLR